MVKDIMIANESIAPNSREMDILKEYFPSCFHSDGSFDLSRFQEFLSDKVDVTHEGYELKFLGKNYARLLASVDTTTVIVPDEEHNSKPEKGLRTFYWTKWTPTSLFYIPLDLVRQETALFAYPGTKPYTNQYAV